MNALSQVAAAGSPCTKTGLSWHIAKSHRQGTYQDRTWDCPHCPRTFELEDGLTKHLPLHRPGARPIL